MTREILDKYWHLPFIALAIIIGFYLRIVNPWNSVFVPWMDGARLGGNDPWYYFRLIDNCLHNFPDRIWFDAFTYYPYGTYVHFGPFLVYFSAIVAKLAGAATPAQIRSVIAFVPTIGGSLLALPAYLLTKEVFNKKAGVIASLLVVIIPGQLLARSVLGFNDHHVWEVFWMTSTLALFACSVNSFGKVELRNLSELSEKKRELLIAVSAGLAFGFYLLAWAAGFFTAFMILVYAFFAYAMKNYLRTNTLSIATTSVVTFLVAAIIYLPFAFKAPGYGLMFYSPLQLYMLLLSIVIIIVFYLIDYLDRRGYYASIGLKGNYFPIIITAISLILLGIVLIIAPVIHSTIIGIIGVTKPAGGALTIAEVQPFFTMYGGQFTLVPAWQNFAMTFFFAIPGIVYTVYKLIKERKSLYLFVLVWGIVMLVALTGQNRFAYYFGVVSAVFAAVMLDALLKWLKFYEAISNAAKDGWKGIERVGYTKFVVAILLVLILFHPTLSEANTYSKYGGGINKQWYDALVWIRENTPGKDFYDKYYYELYKPGKPGEPYPYPEGTYGVMSWWDYGHWITAIAHRIPNANPFQEGIGNKYDNQPGAAPFFTAFNESYANAIADNLGVKYVISDVEMATAKFYAMAVWAEGSLDKAWKVYYAGTGYVYQSPHGIGIAFNRFAIPGNAKVIRILNVPSESYYRTMEARFHIFDGCGLQHYRMVYESGFVNVFNSMGFDEMMYRNIYNNAYAKMGLPKVNITPTGYVKVFEYVKGVKITGRVPTGMDEVVIKATITTNQNRTFVYEQKASIKNGTYKLIVPYAQNSKYPVKASDYTITAGSVTKTVSVSDKDVEEGRTIVVDLV